MNKTVESFMQEVPREAHLVSTRIVKDSRCLMLDTGSLRDLKANIWHEFVTIYMLGYRDCEDEFVGFAELDNTVLNRQAVEKCRENFEAFLKENKLNLSPQRAQRSE